MKALLRTLIPRPLLTAYHRTLAWVAAVRYGHPSRQLTVVGVTGTNGKSTVVSMLDHLLRSQGFIVGVTGTVLYRVADRTWLNDTKMTMLGRFRLQRLLREMVDAGCTHAVIETSSEGVAQSRHRGIAYDVVVWTNLTPEHIESHGSFAAYRDAKVELFRHLARGRKANRVGAVNVDDPNVSAFLVPGVPRVVGFSLGVPQVVRDHLDVLTARDVQSTAQGMRYRVNDVDGTLALRGVFNVENALACIAGAYALGVPVSASVHALRSMAPVPGRLETIDEGQSFTVIVDYAPEPTGMTKSYEVIDTLPHRKILHILGSAGGGRDVTRRPMLGRIAAEHADVVIVTNEDPYDDDPQTIIDQVAAGARDAGKIDGTSLFTFAERREAMQFALTSAQEGDIVFITGKGAEQAMMVKGGKIPWDDRAVVRDILSQRRQ